MSRSRIEPRRGDLLLVRLDPGEGSEQAGVRPAVVVSNDLANRSLSVFTVAPLTTKGKPYPAWARIEAGDGGLKATSYAMATQLRTLAQTRIAGRQGRLSKDAMERVESAIRLHLDLDVRPEAAGE
jgi:mRNA interferase MazF